MARGGALKVIGMIRQARPAGFCPACRLVLSGSGGEPESAAPMIAALVVFGVAGAAWAAMLWQSSSMAGGAMGLGSIDRFAATWLTMMAAMMLPSAIPLVVEFARMAEGRIGWQVATTVVAVTYLGIWLVFGLVCYAIYNTAGMPWPDHTLVIGLALALAGAYALSPIKRASQARCHELDALHGPLPFNLMRSAVFVGARYSLSCIGCSAGLMVAMVLIGMSSLGWAAFMAIVVFVYKWAPQLRMRYELVLTLALLVLGAIDLAR